MSKLQSYTCAKCGAVLSVDKLQGQMACPFCGNEFDYIDFHREDLIRQANDCLARGAYTAAKEKFNTVLRNDPSDVEAYRGLILCAAKIQSTEDLSDRYDKVSDDFDSIKKIAVSAKQHVTVEEYTYLDNLAILFEIPTLYCKFEKRKDVSQELERKRSIQSEENDKSTGSLTLISVIVVAILLSMSFAFIGTFLIDGAGAIKYLFFPVLPVAALVVIPYTIYRNKVIENSTVVNVPASSDFLAGKLDEIEDKYSAILSEVLDFEASNMNKADKKVIRKVEKNQTSEPSSDKAGSVICAKCGGLLKLNNDRELYECNSCGVSYGKYLFFGDLTANAVKAVNLGEFDEADQILSHKLTMNPQDFEALLGRFLCAGKWKSLKDIDLDDNTFISHVRNLSGQLDSIEKRISPESQPLWAGIRKLADLLEQYADKLHAFKMVREKYMSLDVKLEKLNYTFNEKEDFRRQQSSLLTRMTPLDLELTELNGKIYEAVKVLTDVESDCVFAGGK